MMYQGIVILTEAPDFYCSSLSRSPEKARDHARGVAEDMEAKQYHIEHQAVFLGQTK